MSELSDRVLFTNEELQYIYLHCDFDENREMFKQIEVKIRKQIPRYRLFDQAVASGKSPADAAYETEKTTP